MWLSATKGGIMKDIKPRVIDVTKNIHAIFYQDGEFEIRFGSEGNRVKIFEFTKLKRIKCSTIEGGLRNIHLEDPYKNYKEFRHLIRLCEIQDDIPAWLKALAVWRFDKPAKTRMVEDRIGCVVFFREEEY